MLPINRILRPTCPSAYKHFHSGRVSQRRAPKNPSHGQRARSRRDREEATAILVVFLLAVGVSDFVIPSYRASTPTAEPGPTPITSQLGSRHRGHMMATSMPPGRPGNLTPAQEAKLKEMWLAVFEVFGLVQDDKDNHADGTLTSPESTPDGKKKRKARLSLFKGKDKGAKDADASSEMIAMDKYGQRQQYQQALSQDGSESLRATFWTLIKHDNPDAMVLRFLRARKWDVQAAIVMLVSTLHWREKEMQLDEDVMKNGEGGALTQSKTANPAEAKEATDFLTQMRMGKSFLHGTDKEGRPCCYVRSRLHRQGEQSEKSLERFTVYTIETARFLLRPPIDTAVSPAVSF